ncbi:AAA domain protein [Capnocytophaga sp. oral taxon 335 str. F0486]|uniref:DUF4435 domain-containing protein n=1 Tax=Capnocytophaga sp. oral taxon 335 TaxID=712215 RepID=UPI00026F398D|nr:DUF4435 domain-containing protein [Capnocytophaga sp. oral taxon 335]EJF35660.1 AAA domain protein [Capnocytophaga sp. oral taxon 335 str. F0486]
MNINLPLKKESQSVVSLDFKTLVIVGANGSGKTRFGSKIEENYNITHRISAQKSLIMPDFVSTKSKEVAKNEFLYGYNSDDIGYLKGIGKKNFRWDQKPNTHLLNDYEKLLVLLHTEEYQQSLNYKENGGDKPFTKLDKIQEIWEKVLPHRKLKKEAGVIKTYPLDDLDSIYNSSDMSDGERVIFYLIGEVLCVPENSIIILDEPEMHLHKSLVNNMFNLIENAREDCYFIYLTHDINFAITRQNAKKIWMKSYEGNDTWDYEILEDNEAIPESLYLEVLGSRKPILFIEGENKSFDYKLYQYIFPDYTIKSLGSCAKVIEIVKSFNEQSSFHNIKAYGLIDRDRRNEEEIEKLNSKDIWVLDVAEVENLFLEEIVIKEIANYMGKNSDNVLREVGENIYSFFEKEIENQIRLKFKEVIQKRFYELTQKISNDEDIIKQLDSNYNTIDKEKIYNEIKNEFSNYVFSKNYKSILRVFNNKGLIDNSKLCKLTGLDRKGAYIDLVLSLLKKDDGISNTIRKAIINQIQMKIDTKNYFLKLY